MTRGVVVAYTAVDAADAAWANRWQWHPLKTRQNTLRAVRYKGKTMIHLSRELLGLGLGREPQVDHKNRDPLDNRRSNLRVLTNAQNAQNRGPRRDSLSGVRGVGKHVSGKWTGQVRLLGDYHYLGYFDTIAEAETVVVAFRREHMPFSAADQ